MSARPYRLIVFDWDGTLADSQARIVAAVQAAIHELGLPARDPQLIQSIIGLGMGDALEVLFPGQSAGLEPRFVEYYRQHFWTREPDPASLFPGVAGTLTRLQERGYLLAVATGKSRVGLARELEATGIGAIFLGTRCADESGSKPHPQMLEELMQELDCVPDETVMVGDTEYDLMMARNAGVDAVGVSYGAHPRERLLQCAPLVLLDSIAELLTWLESRVSRHGD